MNNKFDSVLNKFLKENNSQLENAEKRIASSITPVQGAMQSLGGNNDKLKLAADTLNALSQKPNEVDPKQQKYMDSFKKLLDTTGQNSNYSVEDFAKDNPDLKDHPQLKSWYTPPTNTSVNKTQSTTPSTTSTTQQASTAGSKNLYNSQG
jgi:hypothetical protein